MSDSLHQGDPGGPAGAPIAKGLWMLGASGAVAVLAVAGTLVVSPEGPAPVEPRQVLTSFSPLDAHPPRLPDLNEVPPVPQGLPHVSTAESPIVVSADEVRSTVVAAELERTGGDKKPRPVKVVQHAKPVAEPVHAVVEVVRDSKVVPKVANTAKAVAQPVPLPWFARQSAPVTARRFPTVAQPGPLSRGNTQPGPVWTFWPWGLPR